MMSKQAFRFMKFIQIIGFISIFLLLNARLIAAQSTAFTYQGKLTDSGNLANGNYDLQFKLFDAVSGGAQQGSTQTVNSVAVSNGIFTVQLDFGVCASCFDGSARFLEIAVKPSGGGSFTTLSPRQPVTSAPYALKTSNLVFNGAYNDGLMPPTVFTASNTFTGDGAGMNTTPDPDLTSPNGKFNTFYGAGAGQVNTTGTQNAFFGAQAGQAANSCCNAFFGYQAGQHNSFGNANAFFGTQTGQSNTTGSSNAFFGTSAGKSNTTGGSNAFFGGAAGFMNTTGETNAFFGTFAGGFNTTGQQNAFFGYDAGHFNTTGVNNAFFGYQAGISTTTGLRNTFIGGGADFSNTNFTGNDNTLLGAASRVTPNMNNATAIGANAMVTQSNTLILGGITGVNNGTSVNVGIGTTTPAEHLHVVGNGIFTGNLTVNGTLNASLPDLSALYLQNTTNQQVNANFNIAGNGTAGGTLTGSIVNAVTQVNINGLRAFTINGAYNDGIIIFTASNTFAGDGAGVNTTPSGTLNNQIGKFNSFVGAGAGQANTTGNFNAFFGSQAGFSNTIGQDNAFFGHGAGNSNITGNANAFFGGSAGQANISGFFNAFFGAGAGSSNTGGFDNAFFGLNAGNANITGQNNAFFGFQAGAANTTGSNNTLIGTSANVGSGNLGNATAIGANASVTQSNSLILGSINGVNGATTNTNIGIGTTAPAYRLTVLDPSNNGFRVQTNTSGGQVASFGGLGVFDIDAPGTVGGRLTVKENGDVGIGMPSNGVPADKLQVIGDIRIGTSGANGCVKNFSGSAIAGTCSSDARFKRDITPFPKLLSKITQLRPVYFYWRSEQFPDRHFGQAQEAGLIAQEVEKVLPELVTEDEQGYKAVNYSKLPLLSIQAIKELKAENDQLKQQLNEQQSRLAMQEKQLSQQQQQMEAIKQLLCQSQPQADFCKAKSLK